MPLPSAASLLQASPTARAPQCCRWGPLLARAGFRRRAVAAMSGFHRAPLREGPTNRAARYRAT
eukprot:4947280-Alexandrium_andersonii.AAC.1